MALKHTCKLSGIPTAVENAYVRPTRVFVDLFTGETTVFYGVWYSKEAYEARETPLKQNSEQAQNDTLIKTAEAEAHSILKACKAFEKAVDAD